MPSPKSSHGAAMSTSHPFSAHVPTPETPPHGPAPIPPAPPMPGDPTPPVQDPLPGEQPLPIGDPPNPLPPAGL